MLRGFNTLADKSNTDSEGLKTDAGEDGNRLKDGKRECQSGKGGAYQLAGAGAPTASRLRGS